MTHATAFVQSRLKMARNDGSERSESIKPREEWELYCPHSPTEAIQVVIRQAIGEKLPGYGGGTLHEIGRTVTSLERPLI